MVDWKQEVMIIFSWHDSWIGQEPLANMCSQTLLGITPKDEVITNMGNLIDKSWHWKLLWCCDKLECMLHSITNKVG